MRIVKIVEVPEKVGFSVSDAARYLGISPNTLRKRNNLGLIPARRDESNNRIFLLTDLDRYLASLPLYVRGGKAKQGRFVGNGRGRKEET